ncbi:hypothetical protein [Fictibacillus terranigra]|uniref:Uncharacterized protein n=1 Tax=Fictibacillus terranigra TaxID=3058424 RepID=A0ABT8E5Z8_9BACL|nr:hypothetical protein [Fictibacillus sp. CENA-BCM004]MDN4073337.1 hypothetical protein [Fictibacillus sp. CENA-BCM004]
MLLIPVSKGPKYTTSSVKTIIGQDHLGIRNVGILIADYLQSGVTSITPRARYWSFFAWVLYDFIQNVPEEKTIKNFKSFLKKQEWYFILANYAEALERGAITHDVIGIQKAIEEWRKPQDAFEQKSNYVQDSFGGYGTYRNVMKILGITKIGEEAKGVHIDRLTPVGKMLAEAFEQTIKHTAYYRDNRLEDTPVPRGVLLDFGRVAALDRLKDPNSKDYPIVSNIFMPEEPRNSRQILRKQSLLYYMHIIHQSRGSKITFSYLQDMMLDGLYDNQTTVPSHLQNVAKGWEIYQVRQLFTYSLDTMWSYLLHQMSKKVVSMSELIAAVVEELENNRHDLSEDIKSLNESIPLNQDFRKATFGKLRKKEINAENHIWQPMLMMLYVYNRLLNRDDFDTSHQELLKLGGRDDISFTIWMDFVQSYRDKPLKEFLSYILRFYILEQHQKVALNKMITTGNETYHFVENDGKLYFLSDDQPSFNVFRVMQGLSILVDLGMVEAEKGVYQVTAAGRVKLDEKN